MLQVPMSQDAAFNAWVAENFGASKRQRTPPDEASVSRLPPPDPRTDEIAGLFDEEDDFTREAARKRPVPMGPRTEDKPAGKPIDEGLLADGLGAFMDVFINYHSGPEGTKIAKWVVAVCQDPRFAKVAPLLEQFHALPARIYREIVEIARGDAKVAAAIAARIAKTARR